MIDDSPATPIHWREPESTRQRSSPLRPVLVVFIIGASLGFAWKQGWFPVEFLPLPAGTLDAQADTSAPSLPVPASTSQPLADALPLPAPTGEFSPFEPSPEVPGTGNVPGLPLPGQPSPGEPAPYPRPMAPQLPLENLQPFRRENPARISDVPREAAHPSNTRPAVGNSNIAQASASFPEQLSSQAQTLPAAFRQAGSADTSSFVDPDAPGIGDDRLQAVIAGYEEKLAAGQVLAAHRVVSEAYWKSPELRPDLQERLDRTATTIFFLPQPHFVEPYLIEPGDRLESIASQYKVPWEYLSKLNRVEPRRIQAGRRLKVVRGPFAAVVELSDYSLTVHLQGYYVRRFPVGIGRDGASPIGKFSVLNKVTNPQYTDPDGRVIAGDDPRNPLGEYWIDLGNSYGIHGTIDPDSIGSASSRGCIRLNDGDIRAVYEFLTIGSEVVIRQ